ERLMNRLRCQFFRHEAHFDERPYAVREEPVINLIDIGKIVDRLSVCVLAVDPDVVIQDRVEAHVAELRYALHFTQVAAIAVAQAEDCAAGAEHLLPKMRKRMVGSRSVDNNGLRCLFLSGSGEWRQTQGSESREHREENCEPRNGE